MLRDARPSTRSSPPCWTRCVPVRACWWSRTCTGATRRRWTSCGSSPAGSARCRCCWCCPTGRGGRAHPLSAVLGDLVAAPDARRLQLTPLSRAAVAELLDGHRLDPVDVHRRTAGNPFFVSQILAQPDSPMPESVRDAVVARTAALTPEVRRALELLSCTPEAVSGPLLAALGVPTATVEALAATGLLDRRGTASRSATRSRARRCSVRWRRARSPRCTQDDRGARGGRRGRQRARPPRDGRRRTSPGSCGTPRPRRPTPRGPARTARPSRSTSSRCGTSGDDRRPAGGAARGPRRGAVPHRPAGRRDRGRGRRRWSCAASSGTSSRSGRGTARSRLFAWYAADRAARRAAGRGRDLDPLRRRRAAGARLRAGQPRLPRGAAGRHGGGPAGRAPRAQRIADELGDDRAARPRRSVWRWSG